MGGARRILAARAAGQLFVAPDNGLLGPLLDTPGARAWSVEREALFLPAPGATFHGRDRFAPVAAALARGAAPEELGPAAAEPVRLPEEPPHRAREDGAPVLVGRVRRVDRFGNLVTDLPASWLAELGGPARVEIGGREVERWVSHYAELPPGEPGALVGSLGTVELSLPGESLAARWRVGRGAVVRILGAPR